MQVTCPHCGTTLALELFHLRKATDEDTIRLTVHKRRAVPGDRVAICPKCGQEFIKYLLTLGNSVRR